MKEIRYIISHKIILALFLIIAIITLLPFLSDGLYGCYKRNCGLFINDMRDGIWFDTIAAVSFKTIPFQTPNFAGGQLGGYHYLPNLFSFLINKLTTLPFYTIRLQFFSLLYFFGIMIFSVRVARKIHDGNRFVFLFLLFFLLGGPLRIVTAIYNHNFTEFWTGFMINTFDARNILISTHTAFSHVLLLFLISNLLENKQTKRQIFINLSILFLLFGTKFYTAITAGLIYFIYSFFAYFEKRDFKKIIFNILLLTVVVIISFFVFYKSSMTENRSIFTWSPFALVHHMIENPGKYFYSQTLTLQRYTLYGANKFSPRLLAIELYSTFLFIIFYFGIRIIGLFYIFYKKNNLIKDKLSISLFVTAIIISLIPLLFIQRGIWFDTLQFLVTASFLLSILAAQLIYAFVKNKKPIYFKIVLFILFFFFVQNFAVIVEIFRPNKPMIVSNELIALKALKDAPAGVVFYPIINGDSPYINVFSEKQSFLNYIHVLDNVGIDYHQPKNIVDNADIKALAKNKVNYLYILSDYPADKQQYFNKLNNNIYQSKMYGIYYKNNKVTIYKLNDDIALNP